MDWFLYDNDLRHERVKCYKSQNEHYGETQHFFHRAKSIEKILRKDKY